MIDIAALVLALCVTVLVIVRHASAGIALLGLLAGVLLDSLLSEWVVASIPSQSVAMSIYVPVMIRLLITFVPVAVSLVAVKITKHNIVLSVIASLLLGFLVFFFGVEILRSVQAVDSYIGTSGLLVFLSPYQNIILSSAAIIALIEIVMSHKSSSDHKRQKRRL